MTEEPQDDQDNISLPLEEVLPSLKELCDKAERSKRPVWETLGSMSGLRSSYIDAPLKRLTKEQTDQYRLGLIDPDFLGPLRVVGNNVHKNNNGLGLFRELSPTQDWLGEDGKSLLRKACIILNEAMHRQNQDDVDYAKHTLLPAVYKKLYPDIPDDEAKHYAEKKYEEIQEARVDAKAKLLCIRGQQSTEPCLGTPG